MRLACLSLCLLAMTPAAAAAGGEVSDASRDASPPVANAWADITRVTLDDEGDSLALGIELAALPGMQPGMAYVVIFDAGGRQWYGGLVAAPGQRFVFGEWANEPVAQEPTTGTHVPGAPGRIRIDFPRDALPEGVTAVDGLGALSLDIRPQLARVRHLTLDEARGDVLVPLATGDEGEAVASAASVTGTTAEGSARVPAAGLAVGLVALALAARLWRRR